MASKPDSWRIRRVGTCPSAPFVNEMSIAAGSTGSKIISRPNRMSSMYTNSNGSLDHLNGNRTRSLVNDELWPIERDRGKQAVKSLAQVPNTALSRNENAGRRITQNPSLWTEWHNHFKGSRISTHDSDLIPNSPYSFSKRGVQIPRDDRTRGDPAWMTN